MRVEYICHACLLIETQGLKIITDPWLDGPAYCDQWHVFPKPVSTTCPNGFDIVVISHGHQDHLHGPTLKKLPKRVKVFYPYALFGGAKEYVQTLGFQDVREAVTCRTYRLSERTSITYVANTHDNIIVIEDGGEVLVNANDALHAYPEPVIEFYINFLRKRWPRVDMLFCGFGSASYFPNAVHWREKNDREIGEVREQLFAHNFCRAVSGLNPRIAVPFAADFALLSPAQRWINEVRFPRAQMNNYYQEHFGNGEQLPVIREMYPGDILDSNGLHAISPYREKIKNDSLNHLINEQYAPEIARLQQPRFISKSSAEMLAEKMRDNVDHRSHLFAIETLKSLKFCVRVTDVEDENSYNVAFSGSKATVQRSKDPYPDNLLVMETSSRIIRYSMSNEWGGDAIIIGYGCEIHILDKHAIEANLDAVCIRLLTRHPSTKSYIRNKPFRALKYFAHSPLAHTVHNPFIRAWVRNRLKPKHLTNLDADRRVWLLKSKEEIRSLYALPLLEAEFAAHK